jgi:hypothetical protein
MHKVIAYTDRAQNFRRRASEAMNSQQKEAEERMAAAWELLAKTREDRLKEGTIQSAYAAVFQIGR